MIEPLLVELCSPVQGSQIGHGVVCIHAQCTLLNDVKRRKRVAADFELVIEPHVANEENKPLSTQRIRLPRNTSAIKMCFGRDTAMHTERTQDVRQRRAEWEACETVVKNIVSRKQGPASYVVNKATSFHGCSLFGKHRTLCGRLCKLQSSDSKAPTQQARNMFTAYVPLRLHGLEGITDFQGCLYLGTSQRRDVLVIDLSIRSAGIGVKGDWNLGFCIE